MPTLSKPQLLEKVSVWHEPSKEMHRKLLDNSETVLSRLRFYFEHNRPEDFDGKFREQVEAHKREVLFEITGALALAASNARSISVPVQIATLKKVKKSPHLIFGDNFPPAMLWVVAGAYQREQERVGTHWPDVMGEAPGNFKHGRKKPTSESISAAASRALVSLQKGRRPGRPRNFVNEILAEKLGDIYRRYNGKITRHSLESSRGNGRFYQIDDGPFFQFVEAALNPLLSYLCENGFPAIYTSGVVGAAIRMQSN